MPYKELMGYNEKRRQWYKRYKPASDKSPGRGKLYLVSCRQLGAPENRSDSREAANRWWEAKRQEIDTKAAPVVSEAFSAFLEQEYGVAIPVGARLADLSAATAEATTKRTAEVTRMKLDLATMQRHAVALWEGRPIAVADADRTVGHQVSAWLALQKARKIAPGRYVAYQKNIAHLEKWIGADADIACFNEAKLEEWFVDITSRSYRPSTQRAIMAATKSFLRRLWELRLIELPRNLDSVQFRIEVPKDDEVDTLSIAEVRQWLEACDNWTTRSPRGKRTFSTGRTKLYILLGLNCAMRQKDMADLRHDEVDWEGGYLDRVRSKRRGKKGAVKVRYKLWAETLELLKQHRSDHPERVLVTNGGQPLVSYDYDARRSDAVRASFKRLWARLKCESRDTGVFRSTGATMLEESGTYRGWAKYYLGHSGGSIAEKHYTNRRKPEMEAQFFAALDWLRNQFLGV